MTTNPDFDTIAAFLDGERIDPVALKRALAISAGRDYLTELVAMRELVAGPAAVAAPIATTPSRSFSWRGLAAAAALALTIGVAGYAAGTVSAERKLSAAREAANKAPIPTREIPPDSGTVWTETSGGHN